MKLFKHDTKEYGIKISKKYLRLAATYRRFSDRHNPHWDFSLEALIDCFNHESSGGKYSDNNGYVHGKWSKDITFAMWVEDLKKGYTAKIEYYTPLNKWWAIPALSTVTVTKPLFPYTDIDVRAKLIQCNGIKKCG